MPVESSGGGGKRVYIVDANNHYDMSLFGHSANGTTILNPSTAAMQQRIAAGPAAPTATTTTLLQRRQSQVGGPAGVAGGVSPMFERKMSSRHHVGQPAQRRYVQLHYLVNNRTSVDSLHMAGHISEDLKCNPQRCCGSLIASKAAPATTAAGQQQLNHSVGGSASDVTRTLSSSTVTGSTTTASSQQPQAKPRELVLRESQDFLNQYYQSMKRQNSQAHQQRWQAAKTEIERRGTYDLTEHELIYGAKLAWRNSQRCIGRIQWSKLQVFDARFVTTPRGMFDSIINHIKYGTNKGNIRSAITVFQQRTDGLHDYRVWNAQLLRYAGYRQPGEGGGILGDPVNVELTDQCLKLGWKAPEPRGRFDMLPLLLSANGRDPEFYNIPEEVVLEVPIRHPDMPWLNDMQLKWFALPAVSGMMFDVGGVEFTACPFSGWFMGTEIGRDLCDEQRYNLLPEIGQRMGLEVDRASSLWKDIAFVELNRAIIHSFQRDNVTIVDHHTASESFMKHLENESRTRGGCPADWVWIVPPMSGSLTPVFHQEMLCYHLKPNYEYQPDAWKTHRWHASERNNGSTSMSPGRNHQSTSSKRKFGFREIARAVKFSAKLMSRALARRVKTTILYATETGRSERFARQLCDIFKHGFDVKVVCLNEYDPANLEHEQVLLIVTSTFGNGDPPENGVEFYEALTQLALNNSGNNSNNNNNNSNNSGATSVSETPAPSTKNVSTLLSVDAQHNRNSPQQQPPLSPRSRRDSFSSVCSDSVQSRPDSSLLMFGTTTTSNLSNGGGAGGGGAGGEDHNSISSATGATKVQRPSLPSDDTHGPLANVYYSVLALGSTAYPKFCQYGKQLDRLLEKLGAERLLPATCADEMMGQDQTFKQWAPDVFKKACDTFCLTEDINMREADAAVMQGDSSWAPGRYRLRTTTGTTTTQDDVIESLARLHRRPDSVRACTFVRKTYLQAPQSQRQTILVELDTHRDERLDAYEPGDHIGIFAENAPELVDAVLQRLLDFSVGSNTTNAAHQPPPTNNNIRTKQFESPVVLEHLTEKAGVGSVKAWHRDERLPVCSLREAFTRYLDISQPPKQMLLERLTTFCTDVGDRQRMERIAKSAEEYEVWKLYYWPNWADVLSQFVSLRIDPTLLLAQLPLLQPRFYSICSSPAVHSGSIHVTVAVVRYRTQGGKGPEHHGLCSSYLERCLNVGDTLLAFVRQAPTFRMPPPVAPGVGGRSAAGAVPMILVGAGPGIAPFRSFWIHRDWQLRQQQQQVQPSGGGNYMALYFGCRQANVDCIYRNETQFMRERRVLQEIHVALSREHGVPKTYVQDLLLQNSVDIYRYIHELGGHMYVCGDVNMAAGVFDALKTIVIKHGNMSERAAKNYVKNLHDTNRYHEDIFGTYIPTSDGGKANIS